MKLRIKQITVPLDFDDKILKKKTARKLGCSPSLIESIEVKRRSLDARPRNPEPVYVLSVVANLELNQLPKNARLNDIEILDNKDTEQQTATRIRTVDTERPLVVGAGHAGLMASLELALAGAKPVLIERGDDAEIRGKKVNNFWNDGILDPESNVLYGEGGAGLFSDGKLTARTKDRYHLRRFFQHLIDCGANPDIMIDSEPHIGSDHLLQILPEIRRHIVELGGEIRFRARLDDLHIEDSQLRGAIINNKELSCSKCILAVGHSARDVYDMLLRKGLELKAKPFAIGVRMELPQQQIDKAQYGKFAGDSRLGPASFRLTRRAESKTRNCYTFCMCPGGKVISCASEPDCLTTNGMSYSTRSLQQGNAAFLVPVTSEDLGNNPLAGIHFQREIEALGFSYGNKTYALNAVRLVDFLSQRVSDLPDDRSNKKAVPVEFRDILPEFVTTTLTHMIPKMLKQLNGAQIDDVLLYGPETRSSSPLRILRDDTGVATRASGLYPTGEGAGYSGGIVSSALDGMKQAQQCINAINK